MSHVGWQEGTITIPAKELPALHKALRDWQNAFHTEVRAKAVELHKSINTRSVTKYLEAIHELEQKHYAREDKANSTPAFGFGSFGYRAPAKPSAAQKRAGLVEEAALHVLRHIQYYAAQGKKGIHQPTVEDVSHWAPAATNRTKMFDVGGEASISFEKNNVTWSVPENNHAVETAEKHPLHDVFFDALASVQWTRGSGGVISGNDEYNQDGREYGGGANYITHTFGPQGTAAKASEMGMTVKAYEEMQKKVQYIRNNATPRRFY